MIPKIIDITVEEDFVLLVNFENNVKKKYDFKRNLNNPIFKDLKNPHLFREAKVDPGGYGISWNDDLDLSENELWSNGELVT
jgi:hypothetical protein